MNRFILAKLMNHHDSMFYRIQKEIDTRPYIIHVKFSKSNDEVWCRGYASMLPDIPNNMKYSEYLRIFVLCYTIHNNQVSVKYIEKYSKQALEKFILAKYTEKFYF